MKIRRALYFDLGVPFPGIQLRFNETLPDEHYTILLSEVPVSQGRLRPGHVLARDTEAHLQALQVPFGDRQEVPADLSTLWVSDTLADTLREAGVPDAGQQPDPGLAPGLHAEEILVGFHRHPGTRFLLTAMEERFPELVKEASRIMPVQKIAEILQRLVSEDISVRNLRGVLEALIEWGQKERIPCCWPSMCASRSSATSATSIRATEHPAGLPAGAQCRGNPARRHPPDLGRQLSGAGPRRRQGAAGEYQAHRGRPGQRGAEAGAAHIHGYPALPAQDDRAGPL